MNKEKLAEALQFAKENGLKSITVDGITMLVPDEPVKAPEPTSSDLNMAFNDQEYSDEEILYWSTPFFDEIQEKKKRQDETKTQDEDVRNG